MTSKYASTSKETLDIPPLSTLKTWVTRKEAVATCRIDDIVRLRTVTEVYGGIKTVPKGEGLAAPLAADFRCLFSSLLSLSDCRACWVRRWCGPEGYDDHDHL